MIDWLMGFSENMNLSPIVLTRGYKAKRVNELRILNQNTAIQDRWHNFGDEPWLLFQNHRDSQLYVSANRVKAANLAKDQADILLLDDGMQYLKLARDLNIVLIDATSGLGNGQIIPLGPLREPIKGLSRADVILFTKVNLLAYPGSLDSLTKILPKTAVPRFKCDFLPECLISSNGSVRSLNSMKNEKTVLLSAIGDPDGFEKSVKSVGMEVIDHLIFPDHFDFNQQSLSNLNRFFEQNMGSHIICTEKDWVKLEEWQSSLPEIFRLKMGMVPEPAFHLFFQNFLEKFGLQSH